MPVVFEPRAADATHLTKPDDEAYRASREAPAHVILFLQAIRKGRNLLFELQVLISLFGRFMLETLMKLHYTLLNAESGPRVYKLTRSLLLL